MNPKEMKALIFACAPVFIAGQFTIAKNWNQSRRLSNDDWIKKMCVCVNIIKP